MLKLEKNVKNIFTHLFESWNIQNYMNEHKPHVQMIVTRANITAHAYIGEINEFRTKAGFHKTDGLVSGPLDIVRHKF